MKDHIKYRIIYTATSILTAAVMISVTAGIKTYRTSSAAGQGAIDTIGLPDLTYQTLRPLNMHNTEEPAVVDEEAQRLAEQREEQLQAIADVALDEETPESVVEAPEVTETSTLDESDQLLVEEDNGYLAATNQEPEEEEEDSIDYSAQLTYSVYKVAPNDTYSKIAQKFNITYDTLLSANDAKTTNLKPGSYLKIPSMSGIIYTTSTSESIDTITKKYSVDAEKCSYVNNRTSSSRLPKGTTIFVPDATMSNREKLEIEGQLFRCPLRAKYTLTSYFGYRQNPFNASKRTYHNGIDMACPTGTNIYPTMGGQVTTSGWSNIYGNYVIIQHVNKYKTLYGHMSKRLVSAGDWVDVNTVIGKVGSTGQSTGPHLHFTIYEGDKVVDPLVKLNN